MMKHPIDNTDADERNNLPNRLRKPGDVASKRALPARPTKSTAAAPSKQYGKSKLNKASSAAAQSKQRKRPTKKSRLIKLLSRKRGCGIDVLVKELSWQAHTIRAAISRLKQEGHEITRTSSSSGNAVYQLIQHSNGRIQ
jgi:hypothetical protein